MSARCDCTVAPRNQSSLRSVGLFSSLHTRRSHPGCSRPQPSIHSRNWSGSGSPPSHTQWKRRGITGRSVYRLTSAPHRRYRYMSTSKPACAAVFVTVIAAALTWSATTLAGAVWRSPVDVSSGSVDVDVPRLAVDPAGDAFAVWYQSIGIHDAIM